LRSIAQMSRPWEGVCVLCWAKLRSKLGEKDTQKKTKCDIEKNKASKHRKKNEKRKEKREKEKEIFFFLIDDPILLVS
jgi:hypothetical protein